jgi:hypothetical protein
MLMTLFDSLGLSRVKPLQELQVDEKTAAQVLAFEEHIFDMMTRFGLQSPDRRAT